MLVQLNLSLVELIQRDATEVKLAHVLDLYPARGLTGTEANGVPVRQFSGCRPRS
jgi:hypothetical protein